MFSLFLLLLAPPLEWADNAASGRMELREDGKAALVYNYGQQLPEGVPEDRRRCCYLHPVLTPGGVTLTDDFPKDHYHHRGLFFGWAVVEHRGQTYDNWMLKGIGSRNLSIAKESSGSSATLTVVNGWFAGERQIVEERQQVMVYRTRNGERRMELSTTLRATDGPVVLKPVQDRGKSYGGLNARFAPRTATRIIADTGPVAKDEDLNPHAWVEYEAVYGGKRAALRIEPDPRNPGAPHQWCLRYYGFAGAAFPGKSEHLSSYSLAPDKPVTLRYIITVGDRP